MTNKNDAFDEKAYRAEMNAQAREEKTTEIGALRAATQAHLDMLETSYLIEINHARTRLEDYARRSASTHLGHNLANHATKLSEIAGQIDALKMMLGSLDATK